MVRSIVKPPAVAEDMVNAPQWPQLAGELKKLESAGVNVGQFLTDAAPVITRMDTDLKAGAPAPGVTVSPAANLRDPWAPPPGQERAQREGPGMFKKIVEWVKQAVAKIIAKVTRKDRPTALGERSRELARLGISAQENSRLVVVARESLADEGALSQMVTSREWPGIASQIKALQEAGHNPREALAGIPTRMQQAAAAGISLSPSEAARGLLADQAKTPVPARTTAPTPVAAPTPPVPGTTATAAPKPTTSAPDTAAAQAPARAAAASAQSTTATPGTTPAPGPQAARTAPAPQATPTRTHSR
ncbi:hypothetical protein BJP40_00135 [Streptomyces sp. CC53]|uniref:hypothetical protein n=1 Tax=Streptomyces sp. CC53 TaxID=1906740 RepID=UPI0008DCFD06|nr:hypothetical protein [Streptomyces sp. CC53]OII64312.1 hypothetical protein BJP40_00135 [Streptomyces sp. CC53]